MVHIFGIKNEWKMCKNDGVIDVESWKVVEAV
jgi:hypothetical protein